MDGREGGREEGVEKQRARVFFFPSLTHTHHPFLSPRYGLGTNSMTGGQKSGLIYGGLALFFALFIAGYFMD